MRLRNESEISQLIRIQTLTIIRPRWSWPTWYQEQQWRHDDANNTVYNVLQQPRRHHLKLTCCSVIHFDLTYVTLLSTRTCLSSNNESTPGLNSCEQLNVQAQILGRRRTSFCRCNSITVGDFSESRQLRRVYSRNDEVQRSLDADKAAVRLLSDVWLSSLVATVTRLHAQHSCQPTDLRHWLCSQVSLSKYLRQCATYQVKTCLHYYRLSSISESHSQRPTLRRRQHVHCLGFSLNDVLTETISCHTYFGLHVVDTRG